MSNADKSPPNELRYVTGDATAPLGQGPRIIAHICNDIGGWGKGFVGALSRKWREPEAAYRRWYRSQGIEQPFTLGQVQFVSVAQDLWVGNIIGQHGIGRPGGAAPVRYEAIREGLARVAGFARENNASVHMPRIGAGLAGGDWSVIQEIIRDELLDKGIAVTVYDLPAIAD
ncbi:MAG TPA: macro domain-containing protein [Capsulimonadaceae bacterium]|nr:macro domain-containing protein [Capsulimonadaceae bacterium]